jgi:predicted amidohydrolase
MSVVKVALLQISSSGTDQEANLLKGDHFCRQAASLGADIALFPEMWNIRYTFFDLKDPASRFAWREHAIDRESHFIKHYQQLAQELKIAIGLTYLEKWDGNPRNSMSLIDRYGEISMTYAKVHTCAFDVEVAFTPGDDFYVCDLDTGKGTVRIGAMICYDREFPESARILMLKGAEIILVPNACEMERHRTGQLMARADENMVGIALANYAAPQEKGHSVAFHPVAFNEHGSTDTLVIEAGEAEGVYLAIFDLERIRHWRGHEVWGNAYRRAQRYSLLTSPLVAEPFKRSNPDGSPYDPQKR